MNGKSNHWHFKGIVIETPVDISPKLWNTMLNYLAIMKPADQPEAKPVDESLRCDEPQSDENNQEGVE